MSNTASIHYVFTQRMEMRLRALGYTQQAINAMTTVQADEILAEFDTPDFTPQEASDQSVGLVEFDFDELTVLNPDPTQSRHDILLTAALAYAKHGLYIMPLHDPLFDNNGNLTGCSCEANKRSKNYERWLKSMHAQGKCKNKQYDPNFKCRTPGKHPRITDWETNASNDPKQIIEWWRKWPTANIGLAVGKSGLITFDRDTYKEIYGDDSDLFTQEDKETVTQFSQNRGEHLIFEMPAGKAYTNANNTLPAGVDIRGVGGMQVLEPSIGPSGNQWQWEEGYSILDRTPKPLPAALQAILDAAQHNSKPAQSATFTSTTTDAPDLIRWRTSKAVRDLINAPGVIGERSENDMKVCTALLYAGATADDIRAIFQHNPIGTAGKYAEAGDGYLARTIGKAQAYVSAHPRPDVAATVDNLLLWVRTTSFEPFIDDKFKTLNQYGNLVYMTDATDSKTADAILCAMKDRKRLTINIGKKLLAKLAGLGSCNTATKALSRLHGWLFDVTIDPVHGARLALDLSRLEQIDPLLGSAIVYKRDQSAPNDFQKAEINEYSPRKATEPFLTGTSKVIKERIQDLAQALDITPAQAKADYTHAGLGESCLRIFDAMIREGDMTAQELADETGKKLSSIRTALRKLVQHSMVDAEREGPRGPKVYSLTPDTWKRIEEIAPNLRTYGLVARRENKRLESAQQWVKREIKERTEEIEAAQLTNDFDRESLADARKKILDWRFEKLGAQRIPYLRRLHPDLNADDIRELAYQVAEYKCSTTPSPEVRTARSAQTAEHRDEVRIIRELANQAINQFVADGLRKPTTRMIVDSIMQFGTFDEKMVRNVIGAPLQVSAPSLEHESFLASLCMTPITPDTMQAVFFGN